MYNYKINFLQKNYTKKMAGKLVPGINFQIILCKKESVEVSMLINIWRNVNSFTIALSNISRFFKNFIFQ